MLKFYTRACAIILVLASIHSVNAQNVTIMGSSFPSLPATSCTNTHLDVAVQLTCSNMAYLGYSVSVNSFAITVDLDYNAGIICLPAIVNKTDTVNLGMLPPGAYTLTINGVLNGTTVSTGFNTLTVNSCCPATPMFSASADTICVGDSIYYSNSSTGTTGQTWYENNSAVSTAVNYGKTYNATGVYSIKLVVTDGSCSDSLVKSIAVVQPSVNLGPDAYICPGDSLMLDAGAGRDSVHWSDFTTGQIKYVTPGTYFVTVYENGCEASDTIDVDIYLVTQVDLGPDTILCYGDTLTLDATKPGGSYLWQDASTNSTFDVTSGGNYYVAVADSNGCIFVDSISITMDSCNAAIHELSLNELVRIYPNPASSEINLEFNNPTNEPSVIELINIRGEIVHTASVRTQSRNNVKLDVSDLPAGMYLLRISDSGRSVLGKVILH